MNLYICNNLLEFLAATFEAVQVEDSFFFFGLCISLSLVDADIIKMPFEPLKNFTTGLYLLQLLTGLLPD